ncbi:MAG: AraC family transcriptional regulator [Bacteroidales bacterium]|jgi:AraC-like DNA-binding protein|nr:AraC family transcriptional regulator [Bacteroidales bacterium]
MNKIPVHKIHEKFATGIFLKRYQDGAISQNGNPASGVKEKHRDNHYLFVLQEKGEFSLQIDFREYRTADTMLVCVLPGQVHFGAELGNVSGWLLGIDALYVRDEWKEILETLLISGNIIVPDADTVNDLKYGFALLDRKIQSGNESVAQDAAALLIGMIAEQYRQRQSAVSNKRLTAITLQFKSLFADHLKTLKKPSQYASLLHISPTYLNEAVKSVTGFPAGYWIQDAVVLEAKRLLFYTDKSVAEIAFELGYDDNAYFTRLFTKSSSMSPSQFRTNYRK